MKIPMVVTPSKDYLVKQAISSNTMELAGGDMSRQLTHHRPPMPNELLKRMRWHLAWVLIVATLVLAANVVAIVTWA